MDIRPNLDPGSDTPLYRQLASFIHDLVQTGRLSAGDRLPPTRDLASQLGLNRTTVSAAYEVLETEGLISGQVGRGSFIAAGPAKARPTEAGLDWVRFFESSQPAPPRVPSFTGAGVTSFAASRPSEDLFPLPDFRSSAETVLASPELGSILQLGPPGGHEPLRRYLLDNARAEGLARPGDDILITNGCQQALDLLCRVLVRPGDTVVVEDPVYPGLRNLFQEAGATLIGVRHGVDLPRLASILQGRNVRAVILTPTFQNPTGETLSEGTRESVTEAVSRAGAVLIENDIYSQLRYAGDPLPTLKKLDKTGDTVILRSFSKIAFPGLRVGWMIGPRPLIARLMEARQLADLHGDQFSQAVVLEFARSGRLERHLSHMLETGRERLRALLEGLQAYMPEGVTYSRPEGGMNVWVKLPGGIDTFDLLQHAHREGVTYIPGRHFAVSRPHNNALRLSFAGLEPEAITSGVASLARAIASELETLDRHQREPVPALV
jgi:DNA-binding transcriptional MocR family regulator